MSRHDKADKSVKSNVPHDTQRETHKISETDLETGFDSEVQQYILEVQNGEFPSAEHSFE